MAQDQTYKIRSLAVRTASAAGQILQGLNELMAIAYEKQASGLDWTTFDFGTDGGDSSVRHLTGAILDNVLGSAVQVKTLMDGGNPVEGSHKTNFAQAKP